MKKPVCLRVCSCIFASLCLVLILAQILQSPCAFAQSETASVSGQVTDQSGAVIPDAELEIKNVDTNISFVTKTNGVGFYAFPSLKPGKYLMSARKQMFRSVSVTGIVLNVQDNISRNFELQVGSSAESVTVTADALSVSTTPSVSTVLDRTFVGNLPLNGRSFQSLILLTPGVTVVTTTLSDLGQFSVNGQRSSANYFTVDGVSANTGISTSSTLSTNTSLGGSYAGLSAFGGTNNLVSADALEEFKIQTSTYSAEFGRQPGGQISLVTRSGANQFHGTLFEYFRNDALDANDWFANASGLKKPALRQNQFGGTFSGPVVIPGLYDGHNRTFFFFSYEGQRLRLPVSGITYVPSLRVRSAAAAAVKPLLNAFPQPTGAELLTTAGVATGWAPYGYAVSSPSTMDAYSIRIDHTLSSKLTLFGRFSQSPSNTTTLSGGASLTSGGAYSTVNKASTQTLTLGATSALTARLSNEFRFNYSRQLGQMQYIQTTQGGAVPVDTALLNNGDGLGGAYFYLGAYSGIVYGGDYTKNYQRQMNVVDNVSLVKGAHQFKFGVDYRRLSPTFADMDRQYVYFMSEAGLNSATATYAFVYKFDSARPRFDNYSVYGQDTWKVTPRLTLDYGLRWELNPAPTVSNGEERPAVVTGINGTDVSKATLAPTGAPFYKTFYRAFAPRVGAAYQLNSTSGRETVLRGGFGVYYDLGTSGATNGYPLMAYNMLFNVPFPLSAANAARPTVTVPTSLPVKSFVYSDAENLKLPYTLQWNVAVEQSLGTQQSLSVSYVGSAARRLLTYQYLNNVLNGVTPNPNFSTIFYTWNGSTSDYDSLQVQYKARLKRGMQALVNYTWAHAIDEVSTDVGLLTLSRGNADFDVRHNLSAAVNYNLPTPNAAPVIKYVFGNWSLDGIVHAQSGLPVDVMTTTTVVVNGIAAYVRPSYVYGQPLYIYDSSVPGGRRFNSAAFTAPASGQQGNFGRNVLRGLPIWQADMALGRSFNLTERWKLQFKGELFNVFNHPMFGGYGTDYRTSTFGLATSTLGRSLGGLSYLYQMGGPRSVQLSLKLTF